MAEYTRERFSAEIEKRKSALAKKAVKRAKRLLRDAMSEDTGELHLTTWEGSFLEGVSERIEQYGSAFTDPEKGSLENPLSLKQSFKMSEINRLIKRRKDGRVGQGKRSFSR